MAILGGYNKFEPNTWVRTLTSLSQKALKATIKSRHDLKFAPRINKTSSEEVDIIKNTLNEWY